MKIRLVLPLFLLPGGFFASAKIGETTAQIETRLGAPEIVQGQSVYHKGAFTVMVHYESGVSVVETVSKVGSEDFTVNEIDTLLRVYGAGQSWEESLTGLRWNRADGKLTAALIKKSVVFTDVAFQAKVESQKQQTVDAKNKAEAASIADAFGPIPPTPSPPAIAHLTASTSWNTPKPPYPAQARMSHIEGTGSVRVTTDGSGHVSSAVIIQSAGSGLLDHNTTSYAEANWSGPPNSSTIVPVNYRLQ